MASSGRRTRDVEGHDTVRQDGLTYTPEIIFLTCAPRGLKTPKINAAEERKKERDMSGVELRNESAQRVYYICPKGGRGGGKGKNKPLCNR